ncbi:uncharacterized protein LOC114251269, partial [Bombyx mandarina]|uniref:Uncharacterized protein LOC114251269 n=1 Tax=Bombyx mandarina TaxID=7092 RepID=A0A6J2KMB8_BOMMA
MSPAASTKYGAQEAHSPSKTIPKTLNIMEHLNNIATREKNYNEQTACVTKACIHSSMRQNHSNKKLDENNELTDLDRYTMQIRDYECSRGEIERRPSRNTDEKIRRGERVMQNLLVKESIIRQKIDIKADATSPVVSKFKYVQNTQEWMKTVERLMCIRIRALFVIGLLLTMIATGTAAPTRSRATRTAHHERSARGYLETFGYLSKSRPEVGNLIMDGNEQSYEDDFRIAIKTLQEFGGIPVTGELDAATRNLMKQKRCGRPDREEQDHENRRSKRFAVQGAKWKHTNLTW